jgi:hypothetical protein
MNLITDGGYPREIDERKRGILTTADRTYLRADEDERLEIHERPGLYQREDAIRERTRNSVLDVPLLATCADTEVYADVFESDVREDSDGFDTEIAIPRTQHALSSLIVFFIRAVRADEPTRPVESIDDMTTVLGPVISEIEDGIEEWLNQHRDITADFELSVSVSKLQTIDALIEELKLMRTSLPPDEWFSTAQVLERAGYDDDEITALIGESPEDDDEQGQSDYPMEQLVSFDVTRLAELFASGVITKEEHRTALKQKSETGDI